MNKIILNERENNITKFWEGHIKNALGFEVDITTLTTIVKKITSQKFFTIAPADYLPVRVGEGAWSSNLVTFRDFSIGDTFETGIVNLAGQNARLAEADSAIDSITVKINNWAKQIGWSIFDLQMAAKSGNWDLVSSKEKARKKNWDLGIQKVAFLGINADTMGLLTQSDVYSNTALIQKHISAMTTGELNTFLTGLVSAYRVNCKFTAYPTHFIIPETDYNGLAAPSSADFPIRSKLSLIEETLQVMTMNKGFKVLPLAYADQINNALTLNRYTMLNYEEESLRMDIPVDYTSTLAMSLNGVQWQNGAYGQFTGVKAYRPLEMIYFDFAN
jgi:hypothetical protein